MAILTWHKSEIIEICGSVHRHLNHLEICVISKSCTQKLVVAVPLIGIRPHQIFSYWSPSRESWWFHYGKLWYSSRSDPSSIP